MLLLPIGLRRGPVLGFEFPDEGVNGVVPGFKGDFVDGEGSRDQKFFKGRFSELDLNF